MKTKIFALILAVLCLSAVLVGCKPEACSNHVDENKDKVCDVCEKEICEKHTDENGDGTCDVCAAKIVTPCEPHKDENADTYCDVCGGAIVVIKQEVKPETGERVPMIVNAIPTDANAANYIVTTKEELKAVANAEKLDVVSVEAVYNSYAVLLVEPAQGDYLIYTVYDYAQGKEIYRTTDVYTGIYVAGYTEVEISLFDQGFAVEKRSYNDLYLTPEFGTIEYYVYTGEKIVGADWDRNGGSGMTWDELVEAFEPSSEVVNGIEYVTFYDGKIWAFDEEDDTYLGFNFDKKSLVHRPEFQVVQGNYGYIEYEGTLYVYDLTKWIDCVYSYVLPTYCEYSEWYVLQNGNVLVQGTIRLLDQAVSYDYVEDGSKFDIEYLLINISEKNVKSIEFGYAIQDLTVPETGEQYTDKALNLVTVTPISNDRVAFYSAASRKQLVVDNELKILCDVTEFADTRLVADNVFLMDTYYDENTKVTTAVNERGEKLATIPYSAEIMENYILYEGDVYNFKMELMLELSQYTVEDETETFMILSKRDSSTYVTTYYYYDPTTKAPVAIQNQNREDFSFNGSAWFGYQISYTNADGDTEYVFYNSENAELSLGQDKTVDLDWWYSDDEESFVIFSMDDGTAYIVRK